MSTSQKTPKLYYFDVHGRGEVLRTIFVLAGKEFEEVTYSLENPDDWLNNGKHTMPFEVMPVLEIEGERYGESIALNTYLAKEYGFHGQTNLEELKINQIVQMVETMMALSGASYDDPDPVKGAEYAKQLRNVVAPKQLSFIEKAVQKFGSKEFAVGDRFTLADIVIYDLYKNWLKDYIDIDGDVYPLSKAIAERVANNDTIVAYKKKKGGQ